ncbi:hypothetical protein ASD15_15840 [Massilia sp. Root351]|nr:hypothetical protein ASD15_15840 [Massilia sp. Root351]
MLGLQSLRTGFFRQFSYSPSKVFFYFSQRTYFASANVLRITLLRLLAVFFTVDFFANRGQQEVAQWNVAFPCCVEQFRMQIIRDVEGEGSHIASCVEL